MRLTKKQQIILDHLMKKSPLTREQLFADIEGPVEDKKEYWSKFKTIEKILNKLHEKGEVEFIGDLISFTSPEIQTAQKFTHATLIALQSLRSKELPLTLGNLAKCTDIRDWLAAYAEWRLGNPALVGTPRQIPLDENLDENIETFEILLQYLKVDQGIILNSGWIFTSSDWQKLQQSTHQILRDKLIKFAVSQEKLRKLLEDQMPFQPPAKTIREMLETLCLLTDEEIKSLLTAFESGFLRDEAERILKATKDQAKAFEMQLQTRYAKLFKGAWEWDRMVQALTAKIIQFAKAQGLYMGAEEWKEHLKNRAKDRFRNAQQSSTEGANKSTNGDKISTQSPLNKTSQSYLLLGVIESASIEEIRVAYRKLAKAHHPDQGGDPEFFRSLTMAYTHLMTVLEG